jgi:hypothetical protein
MTTFSIAGNIDLPSQKFSSLENAVQILSSYLLEKETKNQEAQKIKSIKTGISQALEGKNLEDFETLFQK